MLIDFLVAVITDALGLLGGGDGGGLAGALVTEDQPAVPAVVLQPTHASFSLLGMDPHATDVDSDAVLTRLTVTVKRYLRA